MEGFVNWELIILAAFWVVGTQQYIRKGFEKVIPSFKVPPAVWWLLSAVLAGVFAFVISAETTSKSIKIIANTLSVLSVSQVGYATLFKGLTGMLEKKGIKFPDDTTAINSNNQVGG